jgi:hypothetical protein
MALTSRNGPTDFLRGIFTNAFGELKKKNFTAPLQEQRASSSVIHKPRNSFHDSTSDSQGIDGPVNSN